MNNKSNNKVVIALLAVLIIAVGCVGGYFIIKDINKGHEGSDANNTSQTSDSKDKTDSDKSQGGSSSGDAAGSNTPALEPAQEEIEAGITYAEVRGNDYYIEVQVNGQVNGVCDMSIVPTDGGQGHHGTDDLEIENKVSICDEDFSLKGMNPGEHKITLMISTTDGRTKTLEKIVNI